jgi:hypothetical protein
VRPGGPPKWRVRGIKGMEWESRRPLRTRYHKGREKGGSLRYELLANRNQITIRVESQSESEFKSAKDTRYGEQLVG